MRPVGTSFHAGCEFIRMREGSIIEGVGVGVGGRGVCRGKGRGVYKVEPIGSNHQL